MDSTLGNLVTGNIQMHSTVFSCQKYHVELKSLSIANDGRISFGECNCPNCEKEKKPLIKGSITELVGLFLKNIERIENLEKIIEEQNLQILALSDYCFGGERFKELQKQQMK
jgi:hypothetical protein